MIALAADAFVKSSSRMQGATSSAIASASVIIASALSGSIPGAKGSKSSMSIDTAGMIAPSCYLPAAGLAGVRFTGSGNR
jgi:hypothetical protein